MQPGVHGPVLTGLLTSGARRRGGVQLRPRRDAGRGALPLVRQAPPALVRRDRAARRPHPVAAPGLRARPRARTGGRSVALLAGTSCGRCSSATRTRCPRPGARRWKRRRTCSSTSRTTHGSPAAPRASFTSASRPSGRRAPPRPGPRGQLRSGVVGRRGGPGSRSAPRALSPALSLSSLRSSRAADPLRALRRRALASRSSLLANVAVWRAGAESLER